MQCWSGVFNALCLIFRLQRTYITREIIATDGGNRSSSVELAVTITNVKNQPPQWEKESYEVVIPENTVRDTAVVLRYQITAGNTGGVFDVEPEVGTIFIAQPLDYEETKRYKLYVLASDGKWEDYTAVVVNVVNKNDEAPVFSVNEYYGSVTEELDGSPVFVLQVTYLSPQYVIEDWDVTEFRILS
ncbi:neural-cadherin [Tachysurus ichikawai]